MEYAATVTGYLVIAAACVLVMFGGVAWTIHMIMDAMGVRTVFLKMKRERDDALKVVKELSGSRRLKYKE